MTENYHIRTKAAASKTGAVDYRYGFNGMMKDNEMKGIGNSLDYGDRWLDPRVGRLGMSRDKLYRNFPGQSPYAFANNSPIAMIDQGGKHAEIVIDKGSANPGQAQIYKVTVNTVFLTSTEQVNSNAGNSQRLVDYANEVKGTYGRKTFEGTTSGQGYQVNYKTRIMQNFGSTELKTDNDVDRYAKANPTANTLTFIANKGTKTENGSEVNMDPSQRYRNKSFSHEKSHVLGGAGDHRAVDENRMSGYGQNRQVQDEEVQEFVDPAIQLAQRVEGQNVTIHFFANQDAAGNVSEGYNTYKVYDKETRQYLQGDQYSITTPVTNQKSPGQK